MADGHSELRRQGAAPTPPPDVVLDPMLENSMARLARRARRHWYWARTQGIGRLIEEDGLEPWALIGAAVQRHRWHRAHPIAPGTAAPIFLVGLQRSGTNMVVRGLAASLELEVHNENDRRAFTRFRLRPDETIERIVKSSKSRYVLFKPLCDSHRTGDLLDTFGAGGMARAIWMYRSVDGRLRSAVAKFGDVNRRVLSAIAAGEGTCTWQAQRISPANMGFLRQFDYDSMTAESAAGLFWYIRNSLFFDTGLHDRHDVTIVSWDLLVHDSQRYMRSLCRFLDLPYRDALIARIAPRGPSPGERVQIDQAIRDRCEELEQRLLTAAEQAASG